MCWLFMTVNSVKAPQKAFTFFISLERCRLQMPCSTNELTYLVQDLFDMAMYEATLKSQLIIISL